MSDKLPAAPRAATSQMQGYPKDFVGPPVPEKADGDKATPNPLDKPSRIQYILTVYRNGAPAYSVALPSQPTGKNYSHRVAAEVRYTLDEIPIREHATGRAWGITFQGMTGFDVRPSSRYDGAVISMPGIEALLQFDSFLLQYQKLSEQEGSLYLGAAKHRPMLDRTYLVLYDLDEGLGYRVEPVDWTWDRGGRTRVGNAEWRLSLHGYSPLEAAKHTWWAANTRRSAIGVPLDSARYTQEIQAEAVLASERADAQKRIRAASMLSTVATLRADETMRLDRMLKMALPAMTETPIQSELLQRIIDSAQDLVTKVGSLEAAGADIRNEYYASVGRQALLSVVVAAESFGSAVNRFLYSGIDILNDTNGMLGRLLLAAGTVENFVAPIYKTLAALRAQLGEILEDAVLGAIPNFGSIPNVQAAQRLPDRAPRGSNTYTTQPGDTWQSIAQWYYSNEDVWKLLAAFNNASDAYSSGGAPLLPGTVIQLPVQNMQTSTPNSADPNALYGIDFFVDLETGDLVLDDTPTLEYINGNFIATAAPGRDFRLVRGRDNLVHSLTHQLLTVKGEVPAEKEYGVLPLAPGEPLTYANYASVVIGVVQGLSSDLRIKTVRDVRPIIEKDRVSLSVQAVPVTGTVLGVVVPIGG